MEKDPCAVHVSDFYVDAKAVTNAECRRCAGAD